MNIGLITYHSAYNFGSVLQAYATQIVLEKLGNNVEIINYRMPSQKNFYSLFPKGLGYKRLIKNILAMPTLGMRKKREEKYEELFVEIFHLTEEINEPEDFTVLKDRYDVYVSGSDQVWNRYSNELFNIDWKKYMQPYLLSFTSKKKISYGSSPESMKEDELREIKNELSSFSFISCREANSSEKIEKIINKHVETVLDPTLLLTDKEWTEFLGDWKNPYTDSKYIFYYVFKGTRGLNEDLKMLSNIAKNKGLKIVTSVPLSVVFPNSNVINAVDADARDFLGLIKNAEFIITNSYHGTLFSINFNKPFYSLQYSKISYSRVEQMANRLGFSDRVIYSTDDIDFEKPINYKKINQNKEKYRKASIDYLERALRE